MKHYSNILIVAPDGAPLNTISERKSKFYLNRGLGQVVAMNGCEEYSKVIRLCFEPKHRGKSPFLTQIKVNHCVVCGETNKTTLHHVVPRAIRTHFPVEKKEHQHSWCVLLCKKHHRMADDLAIKIFEENLNDFVGRYKKTPVRQESSAYRAINALQYILNKNAVVPETRIQSLFKTAGIPYIPGKHLGDYKEIQNHERVVAGKVPRHIFKEWGEGFIRSLGGVEPTKEAFRQAFLKLDPKFLLPGTLEDLE